MEYVNLRVEKSVAETLEGQARAMGLTLSDLLDYFKTMGGVTNLPVVKPVGLHEESRCGVSADEFEKVACVKLPEDQSVPPLDFSEWRSGEHQRSYFSDIGRRVAHGEY